MKTIQLSDLSQSDYVRILRRSTGQNAGIMPAVRAAMEAVHLEGDAALMSKYKSRYGDSYTSLTVTAGDIRAAYRAIPQELIYALTQMRKNITAVSQAQLPRKKDPAVVTENGIIVWRQWRPIDSVGLYIPGGKAVYPSSVLMTAIPARVSGCRNIVLCSPPRENGSIPAPVLVAADMAGVTNIFKVGGAEAIAAMCYGTETIPKTYKIFGAGNAAVTAAKMIALETVSIDMPAGPSEIFIIADDTANPAYIAADLLADGEHGEDSACVLITTSEQIAQQTISEIERQLRDLPTADRARKSLETYGLFAVVPTLEEAIRFTNTYAPEHLEIMTRNARRLVSKIQNAGSVFLGPWTSKATGDYATGANHVLPTGGAAKMYPPLGVDAYGKWMQVQKCTKKGLAAIKQTIETVADAEKLPAHKNSVTIRFMKSI